MADIAHNWTGDLSASLTGDLATVDGITLGIQRILRRLMTAQGEYIFHPNYGAGIPQRIGQIRDDRVISAIIRSQIFLEDAVARSPAPVIKVSGFLNGISVSMKYTDAFAQKSVAISFPIYAQPFSQSQRNSISLEAGN
jgi:hypothetical protein